MTLRVDEEILREHAEQVAEGLEPTACLRLVPDGPLTHALSALDRVIDEVVGDDPHRGEWSWTHDGAAVLAIVQDAGRLPAFLPLVVAGLEARGVEGVLEAFDPRSEGGGWPLTLGLLEARLRVRGHREHLGGVTYAWRPDGAALDAAAGAALRWCAADGAASAWVQFMSAPRVELPVDEALERAAAELHTAGLVQVRVGARGVVLYVGDGRVSLIDTDARWLPAIQRLTDLLRSTAPSLAYALVKTGSWPDQVTTAGTLLNDWPPRPGVDFDVHDLAPAFEDEHAPDAFPLQVLGPGYGRIPRTPLYRAEPLTGDATLLTHTNLAAWFHAPIVPPGTRGYEAAAPPVLEQARRALAPILFDPELLT